MVAVMPAATPSREKPLPAPPQLQCSSPIIAGSTTPSELKVVAVMRKNTTLTAASVIQGARSWRCPGALDVGGKIAQRFAHRRLRPGHVMRRDGVGQSAMLRPAQGGFLPATARAW